MDWSYQDQLSGEAVVLAPVLVQEGTLSFSCSKLHQTAEDTLLQPRGTGDRNRDGDRDLSGLQSHQLFTFSVPCLRVCSCELRAVIIPRSTGRLRTEADVSSSSCLMSQLSRFSLLQLTEIWCSSWSRSSSSISTQLLYRCLMKMLYFSWAL